MERENRNLKVLVIILCILVLGLGGYLLYDKVLSDDSNANNENENEISWIDYLLEQKFVSASLNVCSIDGNYVYDKDIENQPNPGASRNITQEELRTLLNTIYSSERDNSYGEIVKGYDYAAPACREEILYNYIHENKEYEFILANASIIVTEDNDFLKILENNVNSYPSYALNQNNSNYFNLVENMMKEYIK